MRGTAANASAAAASVYTLHSVGTPSDHQLNMQGAHENKLHVAGSTRGARSLADDTPGLDPEWHLWLHNGDTIRIHETRQKATETIRYQDIKTRHGTRYETQHATHARAHTHTHTHSRQGMRTIEDTRRKGRTAVLHAQMSHDAPSNGAWLQVGKLLQTITAGWRSQAPRTSKTRTLAAHFPIGMQNVNAPIWCRVNMCSELPWRHRCTANSGEPIGIPPACAGIFFFKRKVICGRSRPTSASRSRVTTV